METTLERFLREESTLIEDVICLTRDVRQTKAALVLKKTALLKKMDRLHIRSLEARGSTIRAHSGSTIELFNKERFKKDYPDLFDKYCDTGYKDAYIAVYDKKL